MSRKEMIVNLSSCQACVSVKKFFYWWIAELVTLLPDNLLNLMQQKKKRIVMDVYDSRIRLAECSDGKETDLGEYQLDQDGSLSDEGMSILRNMQNTSATELVIRLSRSLFMTRRLILPSKTEENLREVLGYEMDQETPFRAEQVYYDQRIVKRLPQQQQIEVQLVFVPRNRVEQLVEQVREWGGRPAVVTVEEERGETVEQCHFSGLNLLPQEQRLAGGGGGKTINRLLLVSTVTLVLVAVVLPLLGQQLRINELEQRIASVREEAETVQSIQQDIETLRSESRLILDMRRQHPSVIDILNELTRLLPDDTWLERFNMKGTHVNIYGFSADASALIELIEDSSLFRDVAFDSPITKDPQTNRYRFQIGAELTVSDS